jgi:hypothetical protein
MAEPFEATYLLFVDMLGFSALVEAEGDELDEISPIFTNAELYSPSSAESLLGYRFINFHQCLNQARVRLQELGAGTGIVFSDSAFFRIDALMDAIQFARTLMFELVTNEIPVRMGLARGSVPNVEVSDRLIRACVFPYVTVSRNWGCSCISNRAVRCGRSANSVTPRSGATA